MRDTKDITGPVSLPASTDTAALEDESPRVLDRLLPLVRAHWRSVWRLLRRLGIDVSALEDATAQVFLRCADEGAFGDDVLPGLVNETRQSLYRSAVRVAGDLQSAAAATGTRGFGSLSSLPPPSLSLADSMTERRGLRQFLDRILARMPFGIRAPFVLCELEGLDVSAAADVMDAPVADTSSRRAQGRLAFRTEAGRVGAADPPADTGVAQGDAEAFEYSPFERNLLRSAELDEAPDEIQEGIEVAVGLGLSADEEPVLDEQDDDRMAALFGQVSPFGSADPRDAEDEVESRPRSRVPLRRRMARVAAAALASGSAVVIITFLLARACSTPPSPVADQQARPRTGTPAEQHIVPVPQASDDVVIAIEQEMRPRASDPASSSRASRKTSQRSAVPQGVLPAPGDPSYEWWIARFPLLEEDWKLLPGAGAAAGRDAALYSPYAGNEGLKDEVSRLDTIRMLLESGRATDAMQSLDAYRDRWPNGAMSVEAMVLRVRALLALGRVAEADQQTQVLESFAPNNQYARNARALVTGYQTSRRK